jgi:putative ABC transport system permease protein
MAFDARQAARGLRAAAARVAGVRGRRFKLVAALAFADYRHEWVMSSCAVLALAAILTPLLVLFGLKYGIVANLLDPLVENPRYREIAPATSGAFDAAWFAAMRAREDVEFVVPKSRSLAASIKLRSPDSEIGRIIDVELIPSAAGDPVLARGARGPAGYRQVVLAAETAEQLAVGQGDRVEGVITRTRRDLQESVRLPLEVVGIAAAEAFARSGLFVSAELIAAVEDFLDGRAVPALQWDGAPPRSAERAFAGFRLYARSIEDVAPIRTELRAAGVDVRTSAADIALVRRLDRNLSAAYWIIASIAIVGFCVSFATNVWANIDRKRREFSMLRLTGFRTRDIVWFPILQAILTAAAAWFLACVAFLIVQAALNGLLAESIGSGESICRLLPAHFAAALVVTMLAAVTAAAAGGRRVAQLEPSLGLRAS